MIKDITFGQYYDSKSMIHKMDPRAKIVLLVLLIVFLFLAKNFYSLVFSAVFIDVPKGCCMTVSVKNISEVPVNVVNANLIVERVA